MTGLLMGILLSRLVSGVLAQTADWRWTFALAAVAVTTLMGWTWRRLAGWAQSLMSIGFAAFWSSLAVFLNGAPFHPWPGTAPGVTGRPWARYPASSPPCAARRPSARSVACGT